MTVQVCPPSQRIEVRGHQFLLQAMSQKAWVEWAELRTLAARDLVHACQLAQAGNVDQLSEILETVLMAEYAMVLRAIGEHHGQLAEQMSRSERQQICEIQDRLNGLDQLEPMLRPFAHGVPVG